MRRAVVLAALILYTVTGCQASCTVSGGQVNNGQFRWLTLKENCQDVFEAAFGPEVAARQRQAEEELYVQRELGGK